MKIAIVSDIHGNMEALKQVSADIDRMRVDLTVSLGDNIGYGPDPAGVIQFLRERRISSVMGNHELAVADPPTLELFNPLARRSILMTIPMLSDEDLCYIGGLPHCQVFHGYRFVHAFPPGSLMTYLSGASNNALRLAFSRIEEPLCFVGHTHLLELVTYDRRDVLRTPLREGVASLDKDKRYIINCGSVGQPRDWNNQAKYVILDTENYRVTVRYIAYNIPKVVKKILAAGLPKAHADRLR